VEYAIVNREGSLSDTGALVADTGRFTGRSPFDRYVVQDEVTKDTVWWGNNNQPISETSFEYLFKQMGMYFTDRDLFVRDGLAGADSNYGIGIRTITETAYQNIFAHNLFIRPTAADCAVRPEWSILAAPGYSCTRSEESGLRQSNFVVISFKQKV